jgi:hypothetical protein
MGDVGLPGGIMDNPDSAPLAPFAELPYAPSVSQPRQRGVIEVIGACAAIGLALNFAIPGARP